MPTAGRAQPTPGANSQGLHVSAASSAHLAEGPPKATVKVRIDLAPFE